MESNTVSITVNWYKVARAAKKWVLFRCNGTTYLVDLKEEVIRLPFVYLSFFCRKTL